MKIKKQPKKLSENYKDKSALCNKDRYDYDNPQIEEDDKIAKANEFDSMEKSPIRYDDANIKKSLFNNDNNIIGTPNQNNENNNNNFVLNIQPIVKNLHFDTPNLYNESTIKASSNITFGDNSAQENNNNEQINNNVLISQNSPFSFEKDNNEKINDINNPINSGSQSEINTNNISIKANEEDINNNSKNDKINNEEEKNEIINKEENNSKKSLFEQGTFDKSKIFIQNNTTVKTTEKENINSNNNNKGLFEGYFGNQKEPEFSKNELNINNQKPFFTDIDKNNPFLNVKNDTNLFGKSDLFGNEGLKFGAKPLFENKTKIEMNKDIKENKEGEKEEKDNKSNTDKNINENKNKENTLFNSNINKNPEINDNINNDKQNLFFPNNNVSENSSLNPFNNLSL